MTTHREKLSRMTANADWVRVGGDMTILANMWAHRRDLSVYLGRDGGEAAGAPAFFDPKGKQIEINSDRAFGVGSRGDLVGDLTKRVVLSRYPVAGGMVMHEAGHARYGSADWAELQKRFSGMRQWNVYVYLEECRIEGRSGIAWPKDIGYLRACTREIVMGEDSSKWGGRLAAQLLVGRNEVGILTNEDVAPVISYLLTHGWSTEVLTRLREITREFMLLEDRGADLDRQVELAKELDRIMPQDSGSDGDDWSDLLDAIEDVLARARRGGGRDITAEGEAEADAERREEQKKQDAQTQKNQEKAREIFENSHGAASAVPSQLVGSRPPQPDERAAAVSLARALERAKYRDRTMIEYNSDVPPGRFYGGEAMRMDATRRVGGDTTRYKPFRHKRWEETDEPPLTIGMMSDVSGSMGSVQPAVGQATWVVSEAVSRIDKAIAAQVYFGEKVYPGLRKGERLRTVRTWSGNEGWENFEDGFRALDGELNLLYGTGARLLFVVSDGQYGARPPYSRVDQAEARDRWVNTCAKNGVAVVWIQLRGQHAPVERQPGVEIVTVGTKFVDAVDAIGHACVRALAHASG